MEDGIKLVIATDVASFSHFNLDELRSAGSMRDMERGIVLNRPQVAPWYVEDICIYRDTIGTLKDDLRGGLLRTFGCIVSRSGCDSKLT